MNDGEETVRLESGLDSADPRVVDDSDPFFCMICCGECPLAETFHLGCGHQVCVPVAPHEKMCTQLLFLVSFVTIVG